MSTAPVLDERLHMTVIKALLNDALKPYSAYEYGEVPGDQNNPDETKRDAPKPAIYALVTVERRYAEITTLAALATRSGWRVTARSVGRSPNEARWAAFAISEAIEGANLAIGDQISTPVAHELTNGIEIDEGLYAGLSSYTYVL